LASPLNSSESSRTGIRLAKAIRERGVELPLQENWKTAVPDTCTTPLSGQRRRKEGYNFVSVDASPAQGCLPVSRDLSRNLVLLSRIHLGSKRRDYHDRYVARRSSRLLWLQGNSHAKYRRAGGGGCSF